MKYIRIFKNSLLTVSICVFITGAAACESEKDLELPRQQYPATEDKVGVLMNKIWQESSCFNLDADRKKLLNEMQEYADLCPNTYFKQYYAVTDPEELVLMEDNTILGYHHRALEKVLEEMVSEKVPQGKIVMWQLYNMGYIVKTPDYCFGIDIKHKFSERFAPYLDFLCITHAHEDHYDAKLVDAMTKLGKHVYSSFLDNPDRFDGVATIHPEGDIEIVTNVVDHDANTPAFVANYQIDCGVSSGNKVIFHIGDSYNWQQLKKSKSIDVFIPHLAVGLDMKKAINRLKPGCVLMSHVLEMEHPVNQWRWSYQYGFNEIDKLKMDNVYLPVWGEKMVF